MNGWLYLPVIELRAWEAMTGNVVRREEWQIMREMDQTFVRQANSKEGAEASSSSEISAASFDAVFG